MLNGYIDGVHTEPPRRFPWRLLFLLLIASLAGAAAALPFTLEVLRPFILAAPPMTISLPLLIVLGIAQNLVLLTVVIGLGLMLGRRLGLGAPLLESWLYHERPTVRPRDSVKYGVLTGIAVGVVLLFIILPAAPFLPGLPFATAARVAVWKRVLVCFYGGIDEEIITRLFLLTLLAWLGSRIRKQKALSSRTFWAANIIVAGLFGLGHLPAASLVMHITPTVVFLALLLNGIAAIPFGYLYWKRGLETAMIAHFCADVMMYVLGPAFLKN